MPGRKAIDLTNKRFGSLVVIRRQGTGNSGQAMWLCICDCGASHTVLGQSLRRGTTVRCSACSAANIEDRTRPARRLQLDVYFYAQGLQGGFATARDPGTGALVAHSHNSRTPKTHQDHLLYPQVRNLAVRLADKGLMEPRQAGQSWLKWFARQGFAPRPHYAIAREALDALWDECVASGTGPRPDTQHEPLDAKEQRRPQTEPAC